MGIALDREEQAALLGSHGVGVLATLTDRGAPVPLPVWYVTHDGRLYIRTPGTAKRLAHIARDSRVAFLVHGGEAWAELRGLLVNGNATIVDDPDEDAAVRALVAERFRDLVPPAMPSASAAHYSETVILRIDEVSNRSWDNRKIRRT
jgi:nitroimidazol reductase NimA-like FMN-containing flavoprotein (pyridoxamine 5'-phosphate oxidase superfamily)